MEKLESEVVSCYIGINDETKEFLKFLKNPDFTSDNETKGMFIFVFVFGDHF